MHISAVDTAADIRAFHAVPHFIYKNDPAWVPHIQQDIDKIFDPKKNKFFRNGSAKRWVLRDKTGKAIGRIASFLNEKYSKGMKFPTGGLGFFECTNDPNAARMLLQTAVDWCTERGLKAVDGPINFGEKDRFWGLITDNFTDQASYAMNYNPAYYVPFFEDFGFEVYYEQFVFWRDLNVPAQEVFVRKYNALMGTGEYTISSVRGKTMEQIAEDFRTVYNNAWGGHHGFKKMPAAQAKKIMQAMKPILDPDIVVFVYHLGKPVGFYVNIPELNHIFKHVHGNLNLMGKLKFLYHKMRKTPSRMVGVVFGVDREYHGKGIEGAMIKWTELNIVSLNRYEDTVMTWIGDFNPKMIRVVENLGATCHRKMATYRYMIDKEIGFERMKSVD